jgi:NAD(P)-dependent dehydrogenase (short-subunit alcohol dehydrogenase family)
MDLNLKGKVAIVTGAAMGIGRQIALTFAEEGANVVIADLVEEKAKNVAKEVKSLGVEALVIKTDITKMEEAEEMARATIDRFGKIDILVNNAGTWVVKYFMQTSKEDWQKETDVCWYGVLNCTKAVLQSMINQKSGRIINIGSDAGRVGEPFLPVYSGAKGAVVAFTKGLAKDVARHNILVNVICPSTVPTESATESLRLDEEERMRKTLSFYPLRRLTTTQDIANMVVFLASDRANCITGQTISINAGYCMV